MHCSDRNFEACPHARRKIDLRRLPSWAQWLIALTVVAIVVAAAWLAGRDRPVPQWVPQRLVPALGWSAIGLVIFGIAARLWRRLRRLRRNIR